MINEIEPTHLPERQISDLSPEETLKVREINGEHYKYIERRARPTARALAIAFGAVLGKRGTSEQEQLIDHGMMIYGGSIADTGFIGINEDLRYVLAVQHEAVNLLGTTHREIADQLIKVTKDIDQLPFYGDFKEVIITTKAGENKTLKIVLVEQTVSPAMNPFRGEGSNTTIAIYDEGGIGCLVSGMHANLIENYGFYESQEPPIKNPFAVLPDIAVVLGVTECSRDEAIKIYQKTREKYKIIQQEERQKRETLIKPVMDAMAELGKSRPEFKTTDDFLALIDDRIDLLNEWRRRGVSMENVATLSKWNGLKTYLISLTEQGIDFGSEYGLWFFDESNRFPGETEEEIRASCHRIFHKQ